MRIHNDHYLYIDYFVLFNVKKYYVRILCSITFIIVIITYSWMKNKSERKACLWIRWCSVIYVLEDFQHVFIILLYRCIWYYCSYCRHHVLVTKVWDAFDPVVGLISDRVSTRWGKFRPFLVWMVLPFAIMGIFTFFRPILAKTEGSFMPILLIR